MSVDNVRVSYLVTSSGPSLWGSVGSLVTEPGDGRYLIVRHLDAERGPDGYFVVDLRDAQVISRVLANEKDARAFVAQMHTDRAAKR